MQRSTHEARKTAPRMVLRILVGFSLLAAALFSRMWCQPGREFSQMTWTGATMATTWRVTAVVPLSDERLPGRIADTIGRELDLISAQMSLFQKDSEIYRLNAAPSHTAVPVSVELMDVLVAAQEMSELTGGAFDITVGPLVELWGFHRKEPPERIPDDAEIQAIRERVGYRNLMLKPSEGTVTKGLEGLRVDLSGIAKGKGVDRVAAALERLGIANYLVEIGGEIRARGQKLSGDVWRIGIERPASDSQRSVQAAVFLQDESLATSGDYRSYFVRDEQMYSHTIDPSTGRPVTHSLASVSVIVLDCMTADAAATALLILGRERGRRIAEQQGWAALFISRAPNGGFEVEETASFSEIAGRSGR